MPSNPWRYRCPDNHASLRLYSNRFRCHTCGRSYPKADLVDLADETMTTSDLA